MIKIKDGVKLKFVVPQMAIALSVVDGILNQFTPNTIITSANDLTHMKGSLHYAGQAFDFRTHDIVLLSKYRDRTEMLEDLKRTVKENLGGEFDVLIEDASGPNEHMHVEWDPKDIKVTAPTLT